MFSVISVDVLAIEDHVLDEWFFVFDAVRKLLADQTSDSRQEQQRTERQDAESNGGEQNVEELQPYVLLMCLTIHFVCDAVMETAAVDKSRETSSVVFHPLVTHPAFSLQRHLNSQRQDIMDMLREQTVV